MPSDPHADAFAILSDFANDQQEALPGSYDVSDRHGSITLMCDVPNGTNSEIVVQVALTPLEDGTTELDTVVLVSNAEVTARVDKNYGANWTPDTLSEALTTALSTAQDFTTSGVLSRLPNLLTDKSS